MVVTLAPEERSMVIHTQTNEQLVVRTIHTWPDKGEGERERKKIGDIKLLAIVLCT